MLGYTDNNLTSIELLKKITKYGIESIFNLVVGVDPKNTHVRRIKVNYLKLVLKNKKFILFFLNAIKVLQPTYFNKEYFNKSNMIVSFRNFMNTSLGYLNEEYTYNESNINDLFDIYKKFYLVWLNLFKDLS